MKYTYEYTVRYQDVDNTKHLRWVALEEYLLEVAGTVADDLGFGIEVLHPMGLTWVLTHLSVEMEYMPMPSERIRFETWLEQNVHMLSTRDYRISVVDKDGKSRLIGQCKSVWTVLDMQKREIANIFSHPMFMGCVDGEVLALDRAARMKTMPEESKQTEYVIRYSDLDYNRHCNSCKYLQAMLDVYRPEQTSSEGVQRLDIHYAHEVYEGEHTTIRYHEQDGTVRYQMLAEDGTTSCNALLSRR